VALEAPEVLVPLLQHYAASEPPMVVEVVQLTQTAPPVVEVARLVHSMERVEQAGESLVRATPPVVVAALAVVLAVRAGVQTLNPAGAEALVLTVELVVQTLVAAAELEAQQYFLLEEPVWA
jgi:hypothetical protein